MSLSQKVTTDVTKAEVNRLRDLHGDLTAYARSISDKPADIDFSHYRSTIKSAGVVDAIEKDYNSLNLPQFEAPVDAEAEANFAQLIKDAETAMQASGDRLVELDAMIAEAQNNRTDADTTIQEILERHPEIAAEIQQEIKDDKWFSNQ